MRVTKSGISSWPGVMVTTGVVKAIITPPGGSDIVLQCTINVNDRNWHTNPASAAKVPNGTFVTLPVPPSPTGLDSGMGKHRWVIDPNNINYNTPLSGPNQGYAFFNNNLTYSSFLSQYTITPDLESSGSTFSQNQWGACGFISHSNLLTQTKRHEYNHSTQSHHGKYVTLVNNASNNPGDYYESRVSPPGSNFSQFVTTTTNGITARISNITSGYNGFEPKAVNATASGVSLGNINFLPYTACP